MTALKSHPSYSGTSTLSIFLRNFPLLVLLLHLPHIATITTAQPLLGAFRPFTTRQLTTHLRYCSGCYPALLRKGYCHRLALGKYFRSICSKSRDWPCVISSTGTIQSSYDDLVDFSLVNVEDPLSMTRVIENRPGVRDSLECAAFVIKFVTRDGRMPGNQDNAQLASEGLRAEVIADLTTEFARDNTSVQAEAQVVLDKRRPSGIERGAPSFRLLMGNENGNSEGMVSSSSSLTNSTDESEDDDEIRTKDTLVTSETHDGVGMWNVDDLQLSEVMIHQIRNPLPSATRIRVIFGRRVDSGRVRQVFRIIMARRRVLRVYRRGFRVVRRGARVYDLYAYFSESYRRVYRSIRRRFR